MRLRDRLRSATNFAIDRFFIKQPNVRRAVTRVLEGDSDRQVDVCGTSLIVNTVKEHGYLRAARIAERSSLFRDEVAVVINLAFVLGDGDTFVDVGANVGFYSRTVSRLARLTGSLPVYAFEPNPDTFMRLTRDLPVNVKAEQIAISDRNGKLEFIEGSVSHVFAVTSPSAFRPATQTVSVACRRLDECEIDGDSLVVKIDVEGHEREVLAGAAGLFDTHRVKAIYLDGYTDPSIVPFLASYGFSLLDGRTLEPLQRNSWALLALRL